MTLGLEFQLYSVCWEEFFLVGRGVTSGDIGTDRMRMMRRSGARRGMAGLSDPFSPSLFFLSYHSCSPAFCLICRFLMAHNLGYRTLSQWNAMEIYHVKVPQRYGIAPPVL